MSPSTSPDERKNSAKSKRTSGRPGRFDPDRPLHMTTRGAAAKRSRPYGESVSANGSTEDDDSRRGSFDDPRPATSYSFGSQHSANGIEVEPMLTGDLEMHDASDDRHLTYSGGDEFATSQRSASYDDGIEPSPLKKRKRSSSAAPRKTDSPVLSGPLDGTSERDFDEDPVVETDASEMLLDQNASEDSSETEQQNGAELTPAVVSVNATPAASVVNSPPSSMSGSHDELGHKLPEIQLQAADPGDDIDVGEEVDDGDDLEEGDEDGRPKRRWGGRKRPPHPVREIEAAMRRQLELKKAYRMIAREVKAINADIAKRTIEDLRSNPTSHEDAAEFNVVKAGLDDALARRRHQVLKQQRHHSDLLRRDRDADASVLRSRSKGSIQDLQDIYLDRLEHEMLRIARAAQVEIGDDVQYETEDESDVVPRPIQMGYKFKRGKILTAEHDSRSRQALEGERAAEDIDRRMQMEKLLKVLEDGERPTTSGSMTVMDSTARLAAIAKRESIASTQTLGDAVAEIERRTQLMVPNKAAHGLQLLGDAALKPATRASAAKKEAATSRTRSGRVATPATSTQPPQRPLPADPPSRPDRLGMDRYIGSMPPPPPHTPRQSNLTFVYSPQLRQPEASATSPKARPEAATTKPPDREAQTRTQPSPNQPPGPVQRPEPRREDPAVKRETADFLRETMRDLFWDPLFRRSDAEIRNRNALGGWRGAEPGPGLRPAVSRPSLQSSLSSAEPWRSLRPTEQARAPEPAQTRPLAGAPRTERSSLDRRDYLFDLFPFNRPGYMIEERRAREREAARRSAPDIGPHASRSKPPEAPKSGNNDKSAPLRPEEKKTTPGLSRAPSLSTMSTTAGPSSSTPSATSKAPERPGLQSRFPLSSSLSGLPPPPPGPMLPLAPYTPQYGQRPSQSPAFPRSEASKDPLHRNKFPSLAQHPPLGWNPPSQRSPLYSVPQRPPAPPTGSSDRYPHIFAQGPLQRPPPPPAPAPTPSFQPTPSSSNTTPTTTAPLTQQFGGQPIAPATADARFHAPGFRPAANVPAFAQQQRQNEPRRRTLSEANPPSKWQHWAPGPVRKR